LEFLFVYFTSLKPVISGDVRHSIIFSVRLLIISYSVDGETRKPETNKIYPVTYTIANR
jgi:hypothetical protein